MYQVVKYYYADFVFAFPIDVVPKYPLVIRLFFYSLLKT